MYRLNNLFSANSIGNAFHKIEKIFYSVSSGSLVNVRVFQRCRIITFNNQKKRNSLSIPMIKELISSVETPPQVDSARAIILSSALSSDSTSSRVFSSGHDLREFSYSAPADSSTSSPPDSASEALGLLTKLCKLLAITSPLISIACIPANSLAAAAGLQIVASCDLAVAGQSATFSLPGIKSGLFCSTPAVTVARLIGRRRAMRMLTTGEPINAEKALEYGLINETAPDGKELDAAIELAQLVCRHSGEVLALGKRAFHEQMSAQTLDDAFEIAEAAMLRNIVCKDGKLGIEAFVQKQKGAIKWTT